jgi:hypothetical protein
MVGPGGDQFHFDPATYLETIRAEVPAYDELQDAVAEATACIHTERVLELGVGTGQTSRRVLYLHPQAELVGIDERGPRAPASAALISGSRAVPYLWDSSIQFRQFHPLVHLIVPRVSRASVLMGTRASPASTNSMSRG